MKEYHKIHTIFKRDTEGTRKLMTGIFSSETFEFLKDVQWNWTEKIDGTNIRIHWDGHKVEIAGRTDNAQIPPHLLIRLRSLFEGEVAAQLFEQTFGEKDVILFGEGYGAKIQKGGGLYKDTADFILFDVMVGDTYLTRDAVSDIAKTFSIDVVPCVGIGTLAEAVQYVLSRPQSTIGTAPMEGVVVRPCGELYDRCGNRIIAKIKVKDFE